MVSKNMCQNGQNKKCFLVPNISPNVVLNDITMHQIVILFNVSTVTTFKTKIF